MPIWSHSILLLGLGAVVVVSVMVYRILDMRWIQDDEYGDFDDDAEDREDLEWWSAPYGDEEDDKEDLEDGSLDWNVEDIVPS